MFRHVLSVLAIFALLLQPAQAWAGEELLIELSLAEDGALLVAYTPPAGVSELSRWNRSPAAREFWRDQVKSLDNCASVDGDVVRLRSDPACRTARLRVQPKLLARNATYEAAQPISDTGVIAYSSYYAVALGGHALRWRWLAPQGGYVLQGGRVQRQFAEQVGDAGAVADSLARSSKAEGASQQIGATQYAYLGRAPLVEVAGGFIVRDPALDDARLAVIREALERNLQDLGQAYGVALPGPVGVVTSVADLNGFHGDTSDGRMMRLRLVPALKDQDQDHLGLQQFMAHEVVHWWNMGVRHSDAARPWLHEGHAEWAALLLLRQRGLPGDPALLAQMETRVNRCLLARGDLAAVALAPGYSANEDPYACGFSLMLTAQAQAEARRKPGDQRSPLQLLAGLHPADAVLDAAGFASWADGASYGPMHKLLLDPTQGFASGLTAHLQALGLAQAQPLAQADRGNRSRAAGTLFAALMRSDCGGAGFWTRLEAEAGHFHLDDMHGQCTSLREGADVLAIEGQALIADPGAAWHALQAACASRRTLSISYLHGDPTVMACPSALPPMPPHDVIRLRPEALPLLGLAEPRK